MTDHLDEISNKIRWHDYRPSEWIYADPPEGDVTRCGDCGKSEGDHPIPNARSVDDVEVLWLVNEVDRLRAERDRLMEGPHRILWNRRPNLDCGSIDEVAFWRPQSVHIEQMGPTCWWIGVYLDDDRYWMGNFTAKTARSGLEFSEQWDAGVGWESDGCHGEANR